MVARKATALAGLLTAVVVLAADQTSKWWILHGLHLEQVGQIVLLPVLNFTMVWNRGVTFGLLTGDSGGAHLALAVFALAVVVVLAVWLARTTRLAIALPVGAIAGGALGNVALRRRGRFHPGACLRLFVVCVQSG
jgi:signal peptidase II